MQPQPLGRGEALDDRRVTLGMDVAKASIEAALCQDGRELRLGTFPNTLAGWEALARQVRPVCSVCPVTATGPGSSGLLTVVVEPTGGYELGLAGWACQQPGWQVIRPNPRQVRAWANSQGRRAKTDRQDAVLLAQYGAHMAVPLWQPLPVAVGALEQLLQQRDEVEALVRRERTRQLQLQARPGLPPAVTQSLERLLEALEQERAALDRAIAEHLHQQPQLAQARERLLSVPGVGSRNVLPLLVLLVRWQTLTDGQRSPKGLVAYVGLDPQPYQSGTSVHRRASISRMGERLLRSRLYMGALGALHGPNPAHVFYDRLVGRGKPKKVALVATARKILLWAWAVFHSGTPFDATKTQALVA